MAIEIKRVHHEPKAEARRIVDELAALFGEQLKLTTQWHADRLTFERTTEQGRLYVQGHIDIAEDEVFVCINKGPGLTVAETWIRSQVETVLDAYFTNAPSS